MKKSNHGFAITTLIYGLSLMGMSIVLLLMAIMSIHRNNTADLVHEVEKELTHMTAVSGVMASNAGFDIPDNPNIVFGNEIPNIDRDNFEKIITVDYKTVPESAIKFFDISSTRNGSVMVWYLDEDNNGLYELYIGQKGGVVAPEDCKYLFSHYNNLKYLDLSNLDTFSATTMDYMFTDSGSNSTEFSFILGEQFDTSKVASMRAMFSRFAYLANDFVLDLGTANFDTSNVTEMAAMFYGAGWGSPVSTNGRFELHLGNQFDTSNVIDMDTMFAVCGENQTTFILDLGNKFDTSKVESMDQMFSGMANRSTSITFDLGDKFNTSNVTNMSNMFYRLAASDSTFELDLSMFDFGKVENYFQMFDDMNSNTKIYVQNDTQRDWIINNPGFAGDRVLIK